MVHSLKTEDSTFPGEPGVSQSSGEIILFHLKQRKFQKTTTRRNNGEKECQTISKLGARTIKKIYEKSQEDKGSRITSSSYNLPRGQVFQRIISEIF